MVRKLGDTIIIDFCTHNPTTGAVSDADSIPACEVFEDIDDTPLSGVTVTKRTGKTGDYRVSIVCSQANGFEVGKSYNVIATATVGTTTGKAVVCSFILDSVRISEIQDITQSDHTNVGTFGKYLDYRVSDTTPNILTASDVADAVQNENTADHTSIGSFGANFSDITTKLNDLTVSINPVEISSAVWNEPAEDHTIIGSFGEKLNDLMVSVADITAELDLSELETVLNQMSTDISTIPINTIQTDDSRLNFLDMSISQVSAGSAPSAAEIADAVWDETKSQHSNVGTYGSYLDAKISDVSSGSGATPVEIADAVWNELASDHSTNGSFGRFLDAKISDRPTNPLLSSDSRLNSLDTSISSRSTQASVDLIPTNTLRIDDTRLPSTGQHIATEENVDAIPTNPLLSNDSRINALDTSISSRATQASVNAIPTNPVLATDTRLNYLDMSISQIQLESGPTKSEIADAVWDELASDHSTTGSFGKFLDANISDRPTNALLSTDSRLNSLDTSISSRASQASVNAIPTNPLLTSDSRLNALDTSISSRLASDDSRLDLYALEATLETIKGLGQTNETLVQLAILLNTLNNKIDTTLTTRASQSSVNAIPTNTLLSNDPRMNALDTSISSRLATNDVRLNYLDMSISQIQSGSGPSAAEIADAVWDETKAQHSNVGTYGSYLDAQISDISGGSGATPTQIADAVWDELASDHSTNGSFGRFLDAKISDRPTNALLSTDSRLNALDTSISSRASQVSVDAIPTNTLRIDDTRLPSTGQHIATEENVDAIPTNPLLSNDARINALDTSISSRASQTSVNNIPINTVRVDDTRLSYLDMSISQIQSGSGPNASEIAVAVWDTTRGDHTNSGTFGKFLDTQVSSIQAGSGPSASDIADAVWNELTTDHTTTGSFGDKLNDFTATVGDVTFDITAIENKIDMILEDMSAIPTSTLLSNDSRLDALDTSISSRASQSSVNNIPINTMKTDDSRLDYLDMSISQIQSGSGPSAAEIADAVWNESSMDHTAIGSFGDKLNDFTANVGDVTFDVTALETKIDAVLSDISSIPTNPLLSTDQRLNALDTSISSMLASDDTRLDYLDQSISQIKIDTSGMNITVDLTSVENKIDLILADTSELQTKWDIGGSLYEMLHGLAGQNSGSGSRLVEIITTDGTETLSAVQVHIYSGRTHIAFGNTDIAGKFTALLDDGTYQAVCMKVGYVFTNPATIVVTESAEFTINASSITIAPPDPSETCRVYEFCFTTDGTPMPSITAIAKIISLPFDCTGKLISGEHVVGEYDPVTGLVYWDFVHNAKVQFEISEIFVSVIKKIPTATSARLSEILR